jgi:hypothetical protein
MKNYKARELYWYMLTIVLTFTMILNSSPSLENAYNHYRGEPHKAPYELTVCLRAAQSSHKVPITTIDKLYAADFEFLYNLNTLESSNKNARSHAAAELFPRSLTQAAKRLYYQAERLISQLL